MAQPESLQAPYLLLALPQMDDPNFMRSVVLITRHKKSEGAEGVILNRALVDEVEGPAQMRAEIRDLSGNKVSEFDEDLFDGGPVDDEAVRVVHDVAEIGDLETHIGEGIYFSSDPASFQKVLEFPESTNRRRFFLGRASWEPDQLESEIRGGAWFPAPLKKEVILFRPQADDKSAWRDEIWRKALELNGLSPFNLLASGNGSNSSAVN